MIDKASGIWDLVLGFKPGRRTFSKAVQSS